MSEIFLYAYVSTDDGTESVPGETVFSCLVKATVRFVKKNILP